MCDTIDWMLYFKQCRLIDFLLILLTITISVWYLQFLWKRRKFYQASFNLPGPFGLPLIGSAIQFIGGGYDIFEYLEHLFTVYPEAFRIWFGTRLFFCVSDPKYFQILLTSPHALKKESLYKFSEPVVGQGLFSAVSVEHWKTHRKIINRTFKQTILNQYMEIFVEQSEVLNDELQKHAAESEIDVIKLVSRCTLDIICETAIGVQIRAQSTKSPFPELFDRVMETVLKRVFNIYYHSDVLFNNSQLGRDFYDSTAKLRLLTQKVVAERKKLRSEQIKEDKGTLMGEGTTKTTFLDFLMDVNDEEKHSFSDEEKHSFSDEELSDETLTFMIAGSDTTATNSCFTLTMLGLHQDVQEKVLAEIIDVVGVEGSVELTHLPQLKYLDSVIKETLRLFPVASIIVRAAEEDIDLGDFVVCKGCSIVFGIFWLHRNVKYWPDPCKFDPDRFLPEEVAKRPSSSFVPFSFGPRNCIGMQYAMMTMKTLLATILRKYRFYTSYKSVEEIELETHLVLRPKDGFKLSFELRNP